MAHRPRPTAPPRKTPKRRAERPGRETLRRLYFDEKLTQREIAERLGAGLSSVRRWMRAEGLAPRAGRQAPKPAAKPAHNGAAYRDKKQWVETHLRKLKQRIEEKKRHAIYKS